MYAFLCNEAASTILFGRRMDRMGGITALWMPSQACTRCEACDAMSPVNVTSTERQCRKVLLEDLLATAAIC